MTISYEASATKLRQALSGLLGATGLLKAEDAYVIQEYGMLGLHAVRDARTALEEAEGER